MQRAEVSLDRIVRLPELLRLTGLSRSTIWRMERSRAFPSHIAIGSRAVGWSLLDVLAWIEVRKTGHRPASAVGAGR
jgi:prophage regulatory protein